MDGRGPKDEQVAYYVQTMSDTDPRSSFKYLAQSDSPPSQNLPPLQPSESKIMHGEPRADTSLTKENAPYNVKAEVTFVGDQIPRKHGMASHLRNTLKQQHITLEGTGNPGYIEDQTSSPSLPGFYCDSIKASQSHDSQGVMRTDTAAAIESLSPLLMLSEEIPLESAGKVPVKFANKVLGNVFSFITIPFTCLILALHHLLRFILQGVAKPLVADSLRLIIGNTLQPLWTDVLKPIMDILRDIAAGLSDITMELIRPTIALLRSIRAVEIHATNRYSIQEI